MRPAPDVLGGAVVLKVADLAPARATGQTRHYVDGRQMTAFAALALARYEGDDAVYVFYCDGDWDVITDTCHADLDDAIEQVHFEFEGVDLVDP